MARNPPDTATADRLASARVRRWRLARSACARVMKPASAMVSSTMAAFSSARFSSAKGLRRDGAGSMPTSTADSFSVSATAGLLK
ncbi:MAG TPA: hypothetical protein VD995_16975 [Azospirillum sp.]|nr:hypothetical protein [Azospirillum sp.]